MEAMDTLAEHSNDIYDIENYISMRNILEEELNLSWKRLNAEWQQELAEQGIKKD